MNRNQELLDRIYEGVQEVSNGKKFREYLQCFTKFYKYSFNNSMLIAIQMPNATHVAGYCDWERKFHRHVRDGEKAIQILAPCFKKKDDCRDPSTNTEPRNEKSEKPVVLCGFRVVNVYDYSQTEGEELPTICNELDFEVIGYEKIFDKLKSIADIPITFKGIRGTAKGYCTKDSIVIQNGMPDAQVIKTLVHELAHFRAHFNTEDEVKKSRQVKEIEAESIAFIVCDFLGLDTSEYSFEYLASWTLSDGIDLIKDSMKHIKKVSSEMIRDLQSA